MEATLFKKFETLWDKVQKKRSGCSDQEDGEWMLVLANWEVHNFTFGTRKGNIMFSTWRVNIETFLA